MTGWAVGLVIFLLAGMLDDPSPLYDEAGIAGALASLPSLTMHRVPGTNHYTIVTEPAGASAVARAVRRALDGHGPQRTSEGNS